MVNNPYNVLDLPEDSSEELLRARYEELKAKYGEQRFKAGEEGNEGANKLSELEEAWKMICSDLERKSSNKNFGGDFGQIDDLVKKGKYDEAQAMLDSFTERGAEWHYLQSIVFYKRDWLTESRKQLKMAVELAPDVEKYSTALAKLEMVMGNPETNAQNLGRASRTGSFPPPDDGGAQQAGNCLSSCCMAYCITDCCCNAMRCCG
ncbi:MAG: hypothetical protein HFE48_02535 [Clostridia bacterium]|nr:hypothetical protein [Clostridia bacterium]